MTNTIKELQKKIKIKFKTISNLKKAITHKSYDSINNYEKLEFLGDRILGLIISKKLLEIYPDEKEGVLDKKLAYEISKETAIGSIDLLRHSEDNAETLRKNIAVKGGTTEAAINVFIKNTKLIWLNYTSLQLLFPF